MKHRERAKHCRTCQLLALSEKTCDLMTSLAVSCVCRVAVSLRHLVLFHYEYKACHLKSKWERNITSCTCFHASVKTSVFRVILICNLVVVEGEVSDWTLLQGGGWSRVKQCYLTNL